MHTSSVLGPLPHKIGVRLHGILLAILILTSAFLHFYRIADPALAIFDERHFATYAAKYALGEGVYDIHPPLGKWILSLPLRFYPHERLTPHEFVVVERNAPGRNLETTSKFFQEYGGFPYVPLRTLSALFGIALTPLIYLFVFRLTQKPLAASIAALFVTFENALLLNSRLVLLDSMYLVLGLLALVLFFSAQAPPREPRIKRAVVAGALWGLALGVKFTAVVFIGPVIAHAIFNAKNFSHKKLLENDWVRFALAGTIMFLFIIFVFHNMVMRVDERLEAYAPIWEPWNNADFFEKSAAWKYGAAGVFEIVSMLTSYTLGSPTSTLIQSKWYEWPFMQRPVPLVDSLQPLALTGNPIVWFSATAAVVLVLLRSTYYRKRNEHHYPIWILCGGYIFSLLPFILVVRRDTYLYHYFPALLFGICLAAYMMEEHIRRHRVFKKRKIAAALVAVVISGFLLSAPSTYGFLIPAEHVPLPLVLPRHQ